MKVFESPTITVTSLKYYPSLPVLVFTTLIAVIVVRVACNLRSRKGSPIFWQKGPGGAQKVDTSQWFQSPEDHHLPANETTIYSGGFSQTLYGLIIGIDNYPALPPLYGAVADANAMTEFLLSDLDVPRRNIVSLRNEQATRARIIRELEALWKNPDIHPCDPILIYYAGHGGLIKANKEWRERYGAQKIQAIFPFDYQQERQDVPISKSGEYPRVNCIPDTTIATLLNKLASEKGDNITVIFDSCYSASGTRDGSIEPGQNNPRQTQRRRSAKVEQDIPHDIDDDLFASEGVQPLPNKQERDAQLLLHTNQTSHIHFAACGTNEIAIEDNGRGVFTAELLKKIRKSRVDNITYHNLMKCLEITEHQSPQCYGKHKDRILFDARISSRRVSFITVIFEYDTWSLKAGAASGVTLGSIWELHEIPTVTSESVGRFKVTNLFGSTATLASIDSESEYSAYNDNHQLYARCIHTCVEEEQVLKVWMSPDDQQILFPGPLQHAGRLHENGMGYTMTLARGAADVVLEIHFPQSDKEPTGITQPKVAFYWCDRMSEKYLATKLGKWVPANQKEVEVVLFAAARWQWNLRHTNSVSKSLSEKVTMGMLQVGKRSGARSVPLEKLQDVDANDDGAIELEVDDSILYGFKLKSKIESPLYVRMFYFDSADFSIGDMFGHNTGCGECTFDIPSEGELLIGSGAEGGSPIRFSISPGSQVEVGYMKLFWSTAPLELDHMEQKSAFKMRSGEMRSGFIDQESSNDEWGTVSLTLVLRERA